MASQQAKGGLETLDHQTFPIPGKPFNLHVDNDLVVKSALHAPLPFYELLARWTCTAHSSIVAPTTETCSWELGHN
eukprot:232365-Amphidinium_carterae.3